MLEYLFFFLSARRLQSDYFCLKIDVSMLDTFSISNEMARAAQLPPPHFPHRKNLQVPVSISPLKRKLHSKLSKEIP